MARAKKNEVEVVILAGGLSTRMGRDKAGVRLGRRTLLGHVRLAAAETGWPVRVIRKDLVERCGPLGGVLTGMLTSKGARPGTAIAEGGHPSPRPSPLPKFGFPQGARVAETPMVSHSFGASVIVFLSCDMPFITASWLKRLVREMRRSGAQAVFTQQGRFAGFPFVLSREGLAVVKGQRVKGEFSLQGLAKVLKAERVVVPEKGAWRFMNVNTPAALEEAQQKLKPGVRPARPHPGPLR